MTEEDKKTAAGGAGSSRADLLESAVRFLSDPKVREAAIGRKIAFLESKGLTSEEIEKAMELASAPTSSTNQKGPIYPDTVSTSQPERLPVAPPLPSQYPPPPTYAIQPAHYQASWKDIIYTTASAGSIAYGIWTLINVSLDLAHSFINSFSYTHAARVVTFYKPI